MATWFVVDVDRVRFMPAPPVGLSPSIASALLLVPAGRTNWMALPASSLKFLHEQAANGLQFQTELLQHIEDCATRHMEQSKQ